MDTWVVITMAGLIQERYLARYSEFFERSGYGGSFVFVRQSALKKLRAEWPKIAEEFKIEIS